ncbi:MAG: 2,3-bisphosphoglycerate-independent phosphoglycerate mutase [Candidatus Sungbacteria bacterium]|nr:2,3-bisphosphoglycerate-independent phosphoglycerate mutase [Candidatus Sungbacteria bacterium]
MRPKPLLLIILDGFGVSLEKEGNPVAHARTPTLDEIERNFPFTTLQASGVAVGLPWGEAGNSEVGHLTMGAGRVIYHHLPRIINSIYDGTFFSNEAFLKAMAHVQRNKSSLHLAGLISSGSVHSYIDHFYALLELAKREKLERVFLHIFTDGKDAPPEEGAKFLKILEERINQEWPNAHFSSVIGRFYAMDRDEKWDRVRACYELITEEKGKKISSIHGYLRESYEKGVTDEFIEPAFVSVATGTTAGKPALVREGDSLIFFNFREDSMRELTHAFADDSFDHFPRKKIQNLFIATMTEYEKGLRVNAAFSTLDVNWPLSRVLSEAGLKHLHIAETEKYAHVTYFFNGGKEKPSAGEERILVPSVVTAHFDDVPEMRAADITSKILENFGRYDVVIANFANADMVGHSGNFKAAVQAVEILDEQLGQLLNAVLNSEGIMFVTGDHGNIELKRDPVSGEKLTKHSMNPVPLYLLGKNFQRKMPRSEAEILKQKSEVAGILTDIAPTILKLLNLDRPQEMTGRNILFDIT